MDTTTNGVSLDELTFELTGDELLQQEVLSGDSCDKTSTKEIEFHNNDEENAVIGDRITDEANDFVTKEFIQADDLPDVEESAAHDDDFLVPGDKTLIQAPNFEDFDTDVPPLSLFPSSRADGSDDSDSEFEVPERLPAQREMHASSNGTSTVVASSLKSQTPKQSENESNIGIKFKPVNANDLQPQILTPRGKVSADLSLLQQYTDITNDSSKDVFVLGENKRPEAVAIANVNDLASKKSAESELGELNQNQNDLGIREVVITKMPSEEQFQSAGNLDKQQHMTSISALVEDNTETDGIESHKPSIVTTAEDWEGVQTVEPGFAHPGERSAGSSAVIESKPLATFSDSWAEFEVEDYSSVKDQIKTHIERRGFSALTHLLFGPPKLNRDLLPHRELVFCIAATQLDNEKESHIRVLQTVYRSLTGSKFDCQRYGGHWEEIGFQGRDPATDLRGTGMLALLHMLFFLRDPSTKELARDVYKLSLHPTQNFPFCVMGINLSRICLQVLREDLFNKECNKRKDVIGTMNTVYAALFLHLYQLWKKGKTIADSGFVLQDVETYCRKHSKNIFKDLEAYEKTKKQQGLFGEPPPAEPAFFSVCKEDHGDDKSPAELY